MRFVFHSMKIVVEPYGAVALAVALDDLAPPAQGATVVVISRDNVDANLYARANDHA